MDKLIEIQDALKLTATLTKVGIDNGLVGNDLDQFLKTVYGTAELYLMNHHLNSNQGE